jgi:hypothetical protein
MDCISLHRDDRMYLWSGSRHTAGLRDNFQGGIQITGKASLPPSNGWGGSRHHRRSEPWPSAKSPRESCRPDDGRDPAAGASGM